MDELNPAEIAAILACPQQSISSLGFKCAVFQRFPNNV